MDNPSLNPLSRRSQADSKIYLFSSLEASFVYHHWLSQKTPLINDCDDVASNDETFVSDS